MTNKCGHRSWVADCSQVACKSLRPRCCSMECASVADEVARQCAADADGNVAIHRELSSYKL